MRKLIENTFIIALLVLNVLLFYYIAVNTVWSQEVLPNVSVKGVSADLSTEELNQRLSSQAMQELPDSLQVEFLGDSYDIPLTPRIIQIQTKNSPETYGKGFNFFKVLQETSEAIIYGVNVDVNYSIDIKELLPHLGVYNNSDSAKAYWKDGIARNCAGRTYDLKLNLQTYESKIDQALRKGKLDLSAVNLVPDKRQLNLLKSCRKYIKEYGTLKDTLSEQLGAFSNEILGVDYYQNWGVVDKNNFESLISNYIANNSQPVKQGQYEIMGDYIALFEPYQRGKVITEQKVKIAVEEWLHSPLHRKLSIEPRVVEPEVLQHDLPVYDFTKLLASGKTRLDKYRNGYRNVYLKYAEHGVREMQDQLIMPGEEFSYIERIKPQGNGRMASGRPIGGGICNSTTTLYRAALEAGFKITERNSHGFYVESYDWGYPLNIVDAAYYTPTSDMKFINNLDYPVLLRVEVTGDDTWQYHTINVYTSSESVDRDVQFKNWKKWNVYSETKFSGSFDRIVRDNGEVVREDNFYTRYY